MGRRRGLVVRAGLFPQLVALLFSAAPPRALAAPASAPVASAAAPAPAASVDDAPADEAPAGEAPADEAPADEAPAHEAPAHEASADQGQAVEQRAAPATPAVQQGTAERPLLRPADLTYYRSQPSRYFLATEVGVGVPVHGLVVVGYGRPHFMWGGLEAEALLAPWFVAASGGLRLQLLVANLGLSVRRVVALSRQFAPVAPSYSDADLANTSIGPSQYTSANLQLGGFIPAGPTLGAWGVRGNYLLDLPAGAAYYNEIFRAVLSDEGALLAHVHWFGLLLDKRLRIGPGANIVLSKSRSATVRVGLGLVWSLTTHLTAEMVGSLAVASPDPDLGFGNKFWGIARLRWTWATGEPEPGFF